MNALNALCAKVRPYLVPALFCLTIVLAGQGVAFAQEETGVTITDIVSASDFTSMITNIGSSVSTVIKAAIGLAVGLFIVGFLFRILKKYVSRGA